MSDETKASSGGEVTAEDRAALTEIIIAWKTPIHFDVGGNPVYGDYEAQKILAAHRLASLAAKEAELQAAQADSRRLREGLADAAVDSKQFTLDVAALQHYNATTKDAWDYWHGGIAYARRAALSATVAAGKAEKT